MRTGARTTLLLLTLALGGGCKGNRDQLLADLQSPRSEVRALAVRKLSEDGRSEDLSLFTRAARDMASIVRGEAATALGKSQDSRVVDLLGELLEDSDVDVQGKAAMALAQVKNDKAKAYLTLQYGRRGRQTREVIVQALKETHVPNAMTEVVAAEAKSIWERNLLALNEGSLPERVGAAEELGKSGRPEAFTRLMPLVKGSQVVLAAAAVRGLGELGDPRAVDAILPLLDESFPELRESAIGALERLRDPKAVDRLQAVAMEKSAASPLAVDALMELPRQSRTDAALCAVALDGMVTEAISAARAMRARGGCPLEPIAERLSRGSSAASGLQAVVGLGPAAKELLPKVLPLLATEDASLRALAVDAAGAVGDVSAAPPLQKAFEQELASAQALRQDWISQPLPEHYGAGFDPTDTKPGLLEDVQKRSEKRSTLMTRVKALNDAKSRELGRPVVQQRVPSELFDDVEPARLEPLAGLLRALGAVKAPGALELLKGFSGDSSVMLRTAALVGLTRLGPEGVAIAKAGLFETERDLLKALALALAEQGEAGQSAIVEMLPQVSNEKLILLDALNRAGPPPASAVETLRKQVSEGGPEGALAATLLGRMKAREAAPTLIKALEDPAVPGRRELLTALGELGEGSASTEVAHDLYNDLPEVRAAAATALARLNPSVQADALEALKSDYYRRVREAATAALSAKAPGAAEGTR